MLQAPPGSPPDVWQQLQANLQECCDQSNVLALQYSKSRRPSVLASISGSVAAMFRGVSRVLPSAAAHIRANSAAMFRGVRRVLRRGIACAAAATALWGVLQVCEPR
jgi:hypothetical protein